MLLCDRQPRGWVLWKHGRRRGVLPREVSSKDADETWLASRMPSAIRFLFLFPRLPHAFGGHDNCCPSYLPGRLHFKPNDGSKNIEGGLIKRKTAGVLFLLLSSLFTTESRLPCTTGSQAVWTGHVCFGLRWKAAYFISSFRAWGSTGSGFSRRLQIHIPSIREAACGAARGFLSRFELCRESDTQGGPRAPSVLRASFVSLVRGFLYRPDGKSLPGPGKGTGLGCQAETCECVIRGGPSFRARASGTAEEQRGRWRPRPPASSPWASWLCDVWPAVSIRKTSLLLCWSLRTVMERMQNRRQVGLAACQTGCDSSEHPFLDFLGC